MSDAHRHAMETVAGVLAESGYHSFQEQDGPPRRIKVPMNMGGGRKQNVFIECSGVTPRGDQLIRVFSGCMELGTEESQTLISRKWQSEAEMCRDLLMRNFSEGYGKFTIATYATQTVLLVCCDQLLPTLDPAELDAMVQYVAGRADQFEEKLGWSDNF